MPIVEDSDTAWEARGRYRHATIALLCLYVLSAIPTIIWMDGQAGGTPPFSKGDTVLEMIVDGLVFTHLLTAFFSPFILLFLIGTRYRARLDRSGITQFAFFGKKEHWPAKDISGVQVEFGLEILKKYPLGGVPVVLKDGACIRVLQVAWLGCTPDDAFDALIKHFGRADRKPHSEHGTARMNAFKAVDWNAVPNSGTLVWQGKRRTPVWLDFVYILAALLVFKMCMGVLISVEDAQGPVDFQQLFWKCGLIATFGGIVGFKGVMSLCDFAGGGAILSLAISDYGLTVRRTWRSVVIPAEKLGGVRVFSLDGRTVRVRQQDGFRKFWLAMLRNMTCRELVNEHRFRCKPLEISSALLVRFGEQSSSLNWKEAEAWRATKKAERSGVATQPAKKRQ
jgi:hypothetical protein